MLTLHRAHYPTTYDPVVLAHARALLDSSEAGATAYIDADLRDTGTILTQAAELLDFSRPVAVTMLTILHAIPDADDPYTIVATVMDAVPPGSYLAISHAAADLLDREMLESIKDAWRGKMQQQIIWRTREQVARFFAGTDLVDPGLVRVEEWRPDPGTVGGRKFAGWAAVGRKQRSAGLAEGDKREAAFVTALVAGVLQEKALRRASEASNP